MADTIPSLWPDSINASVLTPLAILRIQANALGKATKGLLEARVHSVRSGESVQHQVDVIAKALDYTHRILSVTHNATLVYPAQVKAQVDVTGEILEQTAAHDEALIGVVKEVLRSEYVTSVVSSLIARSNEQKETEAESATR